ncbi:MAG: cytochrome c oxidase assembly protein [Phenylobacterium sp.]|nr:cytochrome c oxidase assembly protein [Phenylobacterium sp.]
MASTIPYCGPAPSPDGLSSRWNLDPILLAALAAGAGAWWLWRRRGGQARDGLAIGAFAILFVAFISPLCALTSALFSARVVHHGLLVSIAAPLLAFAPARAWRAPPLAIATALQAALFWLWHAPGPYAWALANDGAYAVMQVTLLGSALGFWLAVRRAAAIAAAGALLITMMQMGLLGALITFAAFPLYDPHLTTTLAWGLSPLEDQQLAGVIMWAPMAGAYMLVALALLGRALEPARDATAS